jgi:hypothetical protein
MAIKDRDYVYVAATAGIITLLWWVWKRNQAPPINAAPNPAETVDGGGFPIPWDSPMNDVYAANPTAYDPPTDSDLTLNINNPYAAMLGSTYMPLFGFVGIAQGVEL